MVLLSTNRIAWTYTDSKNVSWRVAAVKALTDQNKLGGTAWNGTDPPKPGYIKMRRCTISDATGKSRVVPAYTSDATILTAGTTLAVNVGSDQATLTSDGIPIEEVRPPNPRVTKQSA